MGGLERNRLFGCPMAIPGRRQRGHDPFGFHCRWGHMEFFSHQDYTNWGRFHFAKGNWGIFRRGNITVHHNAKSHPSYRSLLTQSFVHKSNQPILCILRLSESFQDSASQIDPFILLKIPVYRTDVRPVSEFPILCRLIKGYEYVESLTLQLCFAPSYQRKNPYDTI